MMNENYLFPFLWIVGESPDGLEREIDAIEQSGAKGFCVESRTCEDFCGENWWRIMDVVLRAAKERGMKVWLLDDKHYPTGFAGGALMSQPQLRAWRIKCDFVDLEGEPGIVRLLLNGQTDKRNQDEILGVFAVRMRDKICADVLADITANVHNDVLQIHFDGIPKRICTVKKTRGGGEYGDDSCYIDMLSPQSVDALVRTVYEPHYERYVASGRYADTFCGFFSDEPRFSNGYSYIDLRHGHNEYQCALGIPGMTYPWCDDMQAQFSAQDMLSLWFQTGQDTPAVRVAYMNEITRRYGRNFSGRLADWCHERHLTYCGHIIEDMGAHARMGCSAGHYFRSQQGADYAAVDIVLHQIKPYYRNAHFAPVAGGFADPMFFDSTLAKLASSCARLYPEKNGRALCEIFGAYGWGESVQEMLYLVHHTVVRGINAFIPHAFSPVFPNADCPPHFFAGGNNPAFEGYVLVSRYMQKLCSMLNERADIKVAVLYHAEAEWSGKPYMPVDTVAAALLRAHIDFDILPVDRFEEAKNYSRVLVPYAAYLPPETERAIQSSDNVLRLQNTQKSIADAVCSLRAAGCVTLPLAGQGAADVRVMRVGNRYFLHNEGARKARLSVALKDAKSCEVFCPLYDVTDNFPVQNGRASVALMPGQAVFLCPSQECVSHKSAQKAVPFEKAEESDMRVLYRASAELCDGDELQLSFCGEWARITAGDRDYKAVGSFVRIVPAVCGKQTVTVEIYKNLAETVRDDLSKFAVLRPAELTEMRIIRYDKEI